MKVAAATKMVTLPEIAKKFTDGPFGSNLKSSHYAQSGVRVLRLQDIGVDQLINTDQAFISREHYDALPRNHCKPGDVIIGTMGDPNLRACVIPDDLSDSLNKADCMMLRVNRLVADPTYISKALNSDFVAHQALTLVRGQTRGRISLGRLKSLEIPLPPLAEQKRIAGILNAADAVRARRREALAQLDSLLQATFLDLFGDPVTNPKGCETLNLSDLAGNSFRNGLSPSTKGKVEGEVLTLSAITSGRFKFDERKKAYFDKTPAPSQMVSTDTFLICRGNGNKHLVGVGAFPDRSSDTICFPDTMIAVTVDPEVLTAPYLQFVWANSHVRRQIESGARTTNGTFKVNQQTLGAVAFPVPPIAAQRRFARVAGLIEEQRTMHDRHLAELHTLFASLQSRAFRGEL